MNYGGMCILPAAWAFALAAMDLSAVSASDIAVSLVNKQERIDIPAAAIERIEAQHGLTIFVPLTGKKTTYSDIHSVSVCVSKEFRERICQFTRRILGEPMQVVVGCKVITAPVVREAICKNACFTLSAQDGPDAEALANKLRDRKSTGCNRATS